MLEEQFFSKHSLNHIVGGADYVVVGLFDSDFGVHSLVGVVLVVDYADIFARDGLVIFFELVDDVFSDIFGAVVDFEGVLTGGTSTQRRHTYG